MSCKRRYFYSYYEAQADPEVKRLKKLSALPLWAGSVVHETIEQVLKTHDAMPSPEVQDAIVRDAVHGGMLGQWRESEAAGTGETAAGEEGTLRFRLFEHEYQVPVDADDKKIVVGIVMRSLRNFFRSDTLREAFAVGRAQWLTVEDLISFTVEGVEVLLRMDLAYRRPDGRVLIVDWKTGRGEGRFNEVQLAGYALYAARAGLGGVAGGDPHRAGLPGGAALRAARGGRAQARPRARVHRQERGQHEVAAAGPRGQPGADGRLPHDRPAAALPPLQLPAAVLPAGRTAPRRRPGGDSLVPRPADSARVMGQGNTQR